MTLIDILNSFYDRLPEEIQDSNSYRQMSTCAASMGQHDLAKGLYEISNDEFTHARFLYKHLCAAGIAIPQDVQDSYEHLKELIKNT